jgi:hypothetical protein
MYNRPHIEGILNYHLSSVLIYMQTYKFAAGNKVLTGLETDRKYTVYKNTSVIMKGRNT